MPRFSVRIARSWPLLLAGLTCLASCAPPPIEPPPGRAAVWGHVTLVPPPGVSRGGDATYGDRRLRGARRVDYSHPGFAVVYVEDRRNDPESRVELTIRDAGTAPRIEPEHTAFRAGGQVVIHNQSNAVRLVSCPSRDVIRRLAPDETIEVSLPESGEHSFHLLEARDSTSQVFASPGPFTLVERTGRFQFEDLQPGPARLGVWHPRFAPRNADVELVPDETLQLEFELGPGARQEVRLASP